MRYARIALPGTCGELVQGRIDGVPFLVSCPIDRWSVVEVRLSRGAGWSTPPGAPKTAAAVLAATRYLGCPNQCGVVRIRSELPRSKGYASSTADVAGAIYALALALGQPLGPQAVARLCLSVEPSDSIMYPGLAMMDYRRGSQSELLGPTPPLALVVVEEGGSVDTLAFNALDREDALQALAAQHREALEALKDGLQRGDWAAVGHGATLSAVAHQQILPKALLPGMLRLCQDTCALGVCAAHSGTLLGLILDPLQHDTTAIVRYVGRHLPPSTGISVHKMVGGGPRLVQRV